MELNWTTRRSRLKNAILASFREPVPDVWALFESFNERDWQRVMRWLDLSGLALYFLDRISWLGAEECIPKAVLVRLRGNLEDNRRRAAALFDDTVVIASLLQERDVTFALLKGITLAPEPVADISLRCQNDIDILIRGSDAFVARDILLQIGYGLDCIKGQEWSFTAGSAIPMKLESLYKVRPQRMVEIHLTDGPGDRGTTLPNDRLARAQPRLFDGIELPALSPTDQFVQQALHVFRHLCSEHTRAQWLLEFWRHIQIRRDDAEFWGEVESVAAGETQGELAIGAVTLLATLLFGQCAPPELTEFSVDRLPIGVRLWVETYGRRVLTADLPASKFYLILREQLSASGGSRRPSNWRSLLPFHWWPTRITRGQAGERLSARLSRYSWEARHAFRRFRFHVWTSVPFAIESLRWRKLMADKTVQKAESLIQSHLEIPPDLR